MGITHETSSPRNPESNGSAEAGVKHLKGMLKKTIPKTQLEVTQACFDFNQVDRAGNIGSPHQMFFQREPRSRLPTLSSFQMNLEKCRWNRERLAVKSRGERINSPKLATHDVGDEVRVFDTNTRTWGGKGVVTEVRGHASTDGGFSYFVLDSDTNRTLLKSGREVRVRRTYVRKLVKQVPG